MSNFIIRQAFAEAMDLHKRNQFDEAKQIYKKILSVDSSEPNANHLISLIYTVEGDYKAAKEHIEKAIEKEPNQAIFHSNYGGLLQTMGKSKDAIRAFKKSLKIDKKCFQSYYSLGILYTDKKEYDNAIESYISALEVNNDSAEAHNNLANLYSSLDNSQAEKHYQRTIELIPQEIYPRLNMSNYFLKIKEYKKAIAILDELVKMDLESKEVYNNLGIAYKGIDDEIKASEMFKKAIEMDSDFTLAKKNLDSLKS